MQMDCRSLAGILLIAAALILVPAITLGSGIDGYVSHVTVQRTTDDTLLWVERSGVSDSLLWVCRWGIPTSPESFDFGYLSADETSATGLTYFTVTNYGEEAIDIAIKGTDLEGSLTWTLSDDGNNGTDIYALLAGLDGGSYNIVVKKNSPYNDLVSSLGAGSSQDWGLQIEAPVNIDEGSEKTATVSLVVSIS